MHQNILPIGVYDKELDLFENQYMLTEGISYNSYLIIDDKIALFDTSDSRTAEEWWSNLRNALPEGRGVDYLIVQHLEPDHSSQIAQLMEAYPECRLVCSTAAARMLPLLTDTEGYADRITTVNDGDLLDLGHHELEFLTAPMVHWPEVMMVFDKSTGTLFCADAFGRFGNPDPEHPWACEARRYYFNIVGKYGLPVQNIFKKIGARNIKILAPLHGPVLEGDLKPYVDLYNCWSKYEVETEGVLVAYASIHGMTAVAAKKMAEILKEAGAPKVALADLTRDDQAEAIEDAFRMSHLVVMSSTYDGDIFPPMHDFIHHLALKTYRSRKVGIVENGLWAPAAGKKMADMFGKMTDITIAEPIVTLRGRLTEETEEKLRDLAKNLLN